MSILMRFNMKSLSWTVPVLSFIGSNMMPGYIDKALYDSFYRGYKRSDYVEDDAESTGCECCRDKYKSPEDWVDVEILTEPRTETENHFFIT